MKNLKEKQINQICKKHPQWKTIFLSYLDVDENILINELKKTFSLIVTHKPIFKNLINEAKFFLEVKDNRSVLERLNDKVISDIHNHKKEQFIKSLKSKKYKKLFNEEIEQEIHTILDNKISIESLKHQFFNKLAKYKNSNELLESIQFFKSKNIHWNKEYYEHLIKEKNLNVDILEDQNGYMMIQVNDYNTCKEIGSDAWCIVYEEQHFIEYTYNHHRQIIALNFDKPIEDEQSMIGFTLKINGIIEHSYLKNDYCTPIKIRDKFKFPPISYEELNTILKEKTNQEAFYLICELGFTNLYHKYLNKKDVEPSADNNYSIVTASLNGNFDIIELLLKNSKVDPSCNNNEPIRSASSKGFVNIIDRLLKNSKVDPSSHYNQAIRLASSKGYIDIVNRLLEDPRVDPSDMDNDAIRLAVRNGNLDIVNRLLEDPRVDPSEKYNEAICVAVRNGNLDIVNRLLEDPRVDPSVNKNKAICIASKLGHLYIVNRLLEDPRVDPSDNNNYSLKYSSEYGHIDIVNRLLEDPRVDPSSDSDYAIGAASFSGHFNVFNRLLEDPRVDPSSINNYALRHSMCPECIELLLKDIRVCKKLKPDWVLENLSEKEIYIYKSTLSKSNNPINIFKKFYFNLILKIKSN